jgi:hypothetical protein
MLVAIHKADGHLRSILVANFVDYPINKHRVSCNAGISANFLVFMNDGEPFGDKHSVCERIEIVMRL